MTLFWLGVIISIITGALVNEFGEVSPWLARRIIVRAARTWAANEPDLALIYEEEWARVVDDVPGKLTKLFHAVRFYIGALGRAKQRCKRSAAGFVRAITLRGKPWDIVIAAFVFSVTVIGSYCTALEVRQGYLSDDLIVFSACDIVGILCLLRIPFGRVAGHLKRWLLWTTNIGAGIAALLTASTLYPRGGVSTIEALTVYLITLGLVVLTLDTIFGNRWRHSKGILPRS